MLTSLQVQNFKAFGEYQRLQLAPLTIFVGPNGSGKTSLLDAIALLAQTAPRPGETPYHFKWQGPLVDFGVTGEAAFHKPHLDMQLMLGVEAEAGSWFRDWLKSQHENWQAGFQSVGYRVSHRRKTEEWKHEVTIDGADVAINTTSARMGRNRGSETGLKYRAGVVWHELMPTTSGSNVLAPNLFTSSRFKPPGGSSIDGEMQSQLQQLEFLLLFLASYLREHVFIVGADRMPRRIKPESRAGDSLIVGRHGEHTLRVLSVIFSSPEYVLEARRIQHWAEVFGMSQLTAGWRGEELLTSGYVDENSQAPLNMESAGFGSQQILPVITQLFAAPRNSVQLIEEPEISLHPAAQVDLAKMFAEAVTIQQQLLVTTHSQTFLLALAEAAESSNLKPSDVAIYHLTPSSTGSRIQKLPLNDNWSIPGWVPSFSEVEGRLLKKWIGRVHDEVSKES